MLISLFAAVLLLVNIWRRGWVLPVIVVALWALSPSSLGSIYPAFVQRFQVTPAELAKEKPYIERNIKAHPRRRWASTTSRRPTSTTTRR